MTAGAQTRLWSRFSFLFVLSVGMRCGYGNIRMVYVIRMVIGIMQLKKSFILPCFLTSVDVFFLRLTFLERNCSLRRRKGAEDLARRLSSRSSSKEVWIYQFKTLKSGTMSRQDSGSHQRGWKSGEFNMTTSPSVGRFSNDQTATLYVKGSSAKFDENDGRKTMAPYSNYGQLSQQASQQPASDIVDLRTATSAESKLMKPAKPTHTSQR